MKLLLATIAFIANLNYSKADVIGADIAASLSSKLTRIAVDKAAKEVKKRFEVNEYAQAAKHLLYSPSKSKVLSLKEGTLRYFLDNNYKKLKQKIPNNNGNLPDNICINILEVISKARKLKEIEARKHLAYTNYYDTKENARVKIKKRIINRKFFRMNKRLNKPVTSVEAAKLETAGKQLDTYGRRLSQIEDKEADSSKAPNLTKNSKYQDIINDMEAQKKRCPNLPDIGEAERIQIKSGSDLILERAKATPEA